MQTSALFPRLCAPAALIDACGNVLSTNAEGAPLFRKKMKSLLNDPPSRHVRTRAGDDLPVCLVDTDQGRLVVAFRALSFLPASTSGWQLSQTVIGQILQRYLLDGVFDKTEREVLPIVTFPSLPSAVQLMQKHPILTGEDIADFLALYTKYFADHLVLCDLKYTLFNSISISQTLCFLIGVRSLIEGPCEIHVQIESGAIRFLLHTENAIPLPRIDALADRCAFGKTTRIIAQSDASGSICIVTHFAKDLQKVSWEYQDLTTPYPVLWKQWLFLTGTLLHAFRFD